MCCDIILIYLGTPMKLYKYINLPIIIILEEITTQYKLIYMEKNGYVYAEIGKGMYSFPQVGQIANDFLTKNIAPHGYYQCRHISGPWRHKWRPVVFPLVVDDFGVKYVGNNHAEHLIKCIKNITQYQWIGLEDYIVELVWTVTKNKDMSPYLWQYIWRVPCMSINKKFPHAPSMHYTNRNDHITGQKLSGHPKKVTNLSSHLSTENIYKRW